MSKGGLPTGGAGGQVLAKNTGANFDTGWVTGGGNVINVGTPLVSQLALWTDATHIQGVATLPAGNFPALAGDIISTAGTFATTYNNPVPTAKAGLPVGGSSGQVLAKSTNSNYDTGWINPPSSGGNVANSGSPQGGQVALWTDATHIQGLTALPSANFPALTGDITVTGGTTVTAYGNAVPTAKGGVPSGGTVNQILQKNSNSNYDIGWVTPSAAGGVTSVFTRTGAIVATAGDYTFAQIGSKPTTIAGYGITDAFTQATADSLYATLAHTHSFASLTTKPTTLTGYGITDAQPLDTELTAIAGLASSTDNFIVGVANVWSARTPAQVRTTLGLVVGTNVQAWDTDLDAIAATASQTAFGRGFLTQVDAAGARGYIGAGSGGGDLSSNTAVSVDNEIALFNLTSGKSIKRAAVSGLAKLTTGVLGVITDNSTNWDLAVTEKRQWDGGATNLTAATGRTSLGGTTLGQGFFTVTNPGAIKFFRSDAANVLVLEDAATHRASIGAGTSNFDGTFTSLTGKPTTIAGYGITDAYTKAQTDAAYAVIAHTHTFASLTSKPTTLSGYGITDAEPALGNPSTNGYILSSTTGGVRSWIAPAAGGGTPAGSSGQFQYNNAGAFGAVAAMSFDGTIPATISSIGLNATSTGVLLKNDTATVVDGDNSRSPAQLFKQHSRYGGADHVIEHKLEAKDGVFTIQGRTDGGAWGPGLAIYPSGSVTEYAGDISITAAVLYGLDDVATGGDGGHPSRMGMFNNSTTSRPGLAMVSNTFLGWAAPDKTVYQSWEAQNDTVLQRSEAGGLGIYSASVTNTLGLLRIATQPPSDNSTKAATTEFVTAAVASGAIGEKGKTVLVSGQNYIAATFATAQTYNTWRFLELIVVNTVDANPLNIMPGIVTIKSTTGFRLQLSGAPDSGNYSLQWAISQGLPLATATAYLFSGPSSGGLVASTPFTVQLPTYTSVPTGVVVTPSAGAGGGTFSPTTVTLTTASPLATFTYTPASAGTKSISVTNSGGLTNPSNLTYSVSAVSLVDGDPVSTWLDSYTTGNNATSTGSARPTFKTNILGGKPVVRFSGAQTMNLTTGLNPGYGLPPYHWITAFVVMKATASVDVYGLLTTSNDMWLPYYRADGYFLVATQVAQGYVSPPGYYSAFHIFTISNYPGPSGASSMWVDGTSVTVVPQAGGSTNLFTKIGTGPGDIAEVIYYEVVEVALLRPTPQAALPDHPNIEKYLGDKYGITVAGGGTAVQPDTVAGLKGWWKADSLG
jgi:hypothetical protein